MMEKQNVINIIFDAGKGSCPTRSREGVTGEAFGELPVARREGYLFDGWFTQADVNGDKVISSDPITREDDVTLYAHYTKKRGAARKKSSFRTQKRILFALLGLIVLLIVGTFIVNYTVSIVTYEDYDGNTYKAKKSDGVYSIYGKDGEELETNSDGYYLTVLGTQLSLNRETGEITEYAVVDTEGSEVVGTNSRILMFPQIKQANIAKIEVYQQNGAFTFYTNSDGEVKIQGYENDLVMYDKEKYAYLCVGAGYPLTMQKLNTEEVLAHGYAEYGLVPEKRKDADGNEYDYKPTRYTVTSKDGVSHTVLIGDPIVSGAGYYVKLDGDEHQAVYIMSNQTYDKALLLPVEQLVTPMIVYPMSMNNYFNVENFIIARCKDGDIDNPAVQVAFSFVPMEERLNTLYSADSFKVLPKLFKYKYDGYKLNGDAVYAVLESLYQTNFVGIRKLGITDAAITEYGLDKPEYVMKFDYLVDTDGDDKTDTTVPNLLMISKRTPSGTYYVSSSLCNTIAEVSESSFYYLNYETIDWLNPNAIWANLAYVRELKVDSPDYHVDFTLDNSASDQSKAANSANVKLFVNGKTPDYIVYKTSAATGVQTKETPVYNFRQFYKALLYATISGSAGEGQIKLTEEQMAAFRAQDDSTCQLVLTMEVEDYAATTVPAYHKENNKLTLVYRFYRYSEGKSYLTINGEGEFFVDASFVEKLIADAERVEKGILVDATSKN